MGRFYIPFSTRTTKSVVKRLLIPFLLVSMFALVSDGLGFALQGNGGLQDKVAIPEPFWVVTPTPFSSVQPRSQLPEEPEEFDEREVEAYYDWRNDMFFRRFDLTGKGTVDYMTARRTYKVWLDDFGTPVVITVADPLFYWIDLNGNGKFEQDKGEMWSDPYEDGLTGNEKPYDSSDLQTPPSEIPLWSAPDPLTPKLPPCDPRFGC